MYVAQGMPTPDRFPKKKKKKISIWSVRAISDMDHVPSVPNLLPGPGLLNLMIWVIIDERFEPIRWSCETLIEFLSRVWL